MCKDEFNGMAILLKSTSVQGLIHAGMFQESGGEVLKFVVIYDIRMSLPEQLSDSIEE
ncbi:hypothetical protein [Chitinophaga polysaccharea]|uniref:hypothetical protein n=1 Tax=Chitinophaga polysaccharea TaxID=1293035 RepID=UPI00163D0294|nr:hypothetical protein [Chitinophaga polysaccharea]